MKWFILSALLFYSAQTAAAGSIVCSTPRQGHQLVLEELNITISNGGQRQPASLQPVINRHSSGNQLLRVVHFEGLHYRVHIQNTEDFNEAVDHLVIRSSAGHEMIYPLSCQRV